MKITKCQLLGLIREALSQDAFPADPYLSAAMHIYKVGKFYDHEYHHLIIDLHGLDHDILMETLRGLK
jgi:hypothetical protein